MRGLPSWLRHLRGLGLTLPWLLYLALVDIVLSLLLPLRRVAPRLVYDLSSHLAESVWAWIQFQFVSLNGAHISCSGDALPIGESAVVVSNHVAWSDFYMIQALAQRSNMLGRCRYLAKKQLRLVPFLGWGLWAMGMPLVSRSWLRDRSELEMVFSDLCRREFPCWLICFTEATRFTQDKLAQSRAWCKKMDRPQPRHLLHPRTKGFVAAVQQLRTAPQVRAVYDVTIAYQRHRLFHRAPGFWETLSLPGLSQCQGYRFEVHAQRFPITSLPETDQGLSQWLERLWVDKGERLEAKRREWLLAAGQGALDERS